MNGGLALERISIKASVIFEILVGLAGLGIGLREVPFLVHTPWLTLLFLFLLGILVEIFPVPLGRADGSLLYVMPLALVASYSSSTAICVTIVAELIAQIGRSRARRWSTWLFNAGQYGIAAYVMTLVYHLVSGPSGQPFSLLTLAGVVVGAATFMVVNHTFINVLLGLRRSFQLSDVLSLILLDGVNFIAAIPFAVLFVVLAGVSSLWAPLLLVPMPLMSQIIRVYRRLSILKEIHTAVLHLASEFDVELISNQVAKTAARITYADAVAVFLMDDSETQLLPVIYHPSEVIRDFSLDPLRQDKGGVVWNIIEAETWGYVPDTIKDSRVVWDGIGREYRSMAVFPMQARGRTQGAVVLYSLQPYAFSSFLEYLQVLAGQIAVLVENAKLYQQLQEQSWYDGATGLYNYRYLYDELEQCVGQAAESGDPLSVAVLDVDDFKKFNDTYGHLAGDAVLQSIARVLRDSAGSNAIAARYGGEEFALLLKQSPDEAFATVDSVRQQIARHAVTFGEQRLQGITVSAGIASYPEHAMDDRNLLMKADSAMYWGAKQRGKNRVARYQPDYETQLFVDGLTGLYTYHFINIRLREDIDAGLHDWAVLCLDLENFSAINKTFGFSAGDQVLREVSRILRECLRTSELACRYGGDEFLILFPGVGVEELNSITQRVQRTIHKHRFEYDTNIILSMHVAHNEEAFMGVASASTLLDSIARLFTDMNSRNVSQQDS